MYTVLVIEPDQSLGAAVGKYLKANDLATFVANDAQSAVLLADENQPDVVVLELALPKNNGLAFLQEFRSYNDWLDVPIIIYTHIPPEETGLNENEWQKYGVIQYLYKPTKTLASLSNSIKETLNKNETV